MIYYKKDNIVEVTSINNRRQHQVFILALNYGAAAAAVARFQRQMF